jgi:hypothetical protein
MSSPCIARCAAVLALFIASAAWNAHAQSIPNPEFDLNPEITAKLMKEKARQKASSHDAEESDAGSSPAVSDSNSCGNVVINSNPKPTNSGIREMFGKESVTIVTGSVVNASNCR